MHSGTEYSSQDGVRIVLVAASDPNKPDSPFTLSFVEAWDQYGVADTDSARYSANPLAVSVDELALNWVSV